MIRCSMCRGAMASAHGRITLIFDFWIATCGDRCYDRACQHARRAFGWTVDPLGAPLGAPLSAPLNAALPPPPAREL